MPYAFGPYDALTRQDYATMVHRAYFLEKWKMEEWAGTGARYVVEDLPSKEHSIDGFDDSGAIADYARSALEFCYRKDMLTGYGGTNLLGPGDKLSRCQMAKLSALFPFLTDHLSTQFYPGSYS